MPHRLVITNQKGGVAKTTTCINLARHFADRGFRVLMVDTDPQGQIAPMLGIKAPASLGDLLIKDYKPESCIVSVRENLDLIASDRSTTHAEAVLLQTPARESAFRLVFEKFDARYDIILVDTAPSISMMQTCALVYAQRFLIPVTMDDLAIQGAVASIHTAQLMTGLYANTSIRPVAFLPVMVDRRLGVLYRATEGLQQTAAKYGVPILSAVRTDQAVVRSVSQKRFLADQLPVRSKAYEDYTQVGGEVLEILNGQADGTSQEAASHTV
jgi:chromosome partitioning protein